MDKDFSEAKDILRERIGKGRPMVLATCAEGLVTARNVSVVRYGEGLCFVTSDRSVKAGQLRENPNVALCADDIRLEGEARIIGGGAGQPGSESVLEIVGDVFPQAIPMFNSMPGGIIIEVIPHRASFGQLRTGDAVALDFDGKRAWKVGPGH